QGGQVLTEPDGFQPLEPLDAVGNYPLSARQQPTPRDVQAEDRERTNPMTTPRTARRQASAPERGREAIGHDPATETKRLAGAPDMGAADAVEDDVDALARETADFRHEVLPLVVDRDSSQVGNDRCTSRRARPVHLEAGEATELQERRA